MAESAAGVLGVTRAIVTDVWRVVIVTPVRHGTLDVGSHSRSVAGIAWSVAVLYTITVASILLANPLRSRSTLATAVSDAGVVVVPTLLLPAVLCLLGISFGLLLAGSQRSPWWRRLLHLAVVGGALTSVVAVGVGIGASPFLNWTCGVLAVVLAAYVVVMWLSRTRAGLDAFVLVLLSSGILLAAYRSLVVQGLLVDSAGVLITASLVLTQVATLALPIAYLSGISACALGVSLVARAGDQVGRRAAIWIGLAITAVALVWQWASLVQSLRDDVGVVLRERAAALVLVALCAVAWWVVRRRSAVRTESAEDVASASVSIAVPISYGVTAAAFLSALLGALIISLSLVLPPGSVAPLQSLLDVVGSAEFTTAVRLCVVGGLLLGSAVLARRGAALVAAVAAVNAVVLGTYYWGARFLGDWTWTPPAIGDIGLLVATGMAVLWSVRRQWDRARVQWVLLLTLLSALVRQADFFAVPLGFVIGASATALLIIGLVWGFLVDGGDTHEDTPRFPADRRLITFLGTFLFGITVVAWAVIGKNVGTSLVLSAASAQAVWALGTALVISVILAATSSAARRTESPPAVP